MARDRAIRRSVRLLSAGVLLPAGVLLLPGTAEAGPALAPSTLGSWGQAIEVPGSATLNAGGLAYTESVSCPSAGNCGAGGFYWDAADSYQAFVVDRVNGTWGDAQQVPGTAALNARGDAQVVSVSCASAGNCGAGGFYTDDVGHQQAFVVNEVSGTWQSAQEVPGTATLDAGGGAVVYAVSCGSAGNCSAGGIYRDGAGHQQAFVVNEVSGTWRSAREVPGTATLNAGGDAYVTSVSCASAGNCGTGGDYTDGAGHQQAFVANEVSGTWRSARKVPGTATLNAGNSAVVESVSCASAGNCGAGGYYTDLAGHRQAFVVNEVSGRWRSAREVPGTATLNAGGDAYVTSVSCASAGNCGAGGYYTDVAGHQQAFVANEVSGTWRSAREVPGTATLNAGSARVGSVSCASAGNCGAGGYYTDGAGHQQAFVVNEVSGSWRNALEVPGTATLNAGGEAAVYAVSCGSAGNCSAGGMYRDGAGHQQAFVVDQQ